MFDHVPCHPGSPGPPENPGPPGNPGPPRNAGCRPVAAITLLPQNAAVPVGLQIQLAADTRDKAGFPITGRAPTWSSSDAGVASVDQNGLVSAVAEGLATISAQVGDVVGSTAVTVVIPEMVRVCSQADGSVPTYATLADGVAAVASGGVVHLCEGLHVVDALIIAKPLTLEPESGADASVQGGLLLNHAMGSLTIRGLTFRKNTSTLLEIRAQGTYADVMLESSTLLESVAFFGGNTISDARVTVRDSRFLGGTDAGVVVSAAGHVDIVDN